MFRLVCLNNVITKIYIHFFTLFEPCHGSGIVFHQINKKRLFMKKTKGFLVAAGLVLAMAFIFSCSSDDGGGGSGAKITKSKITGVSQKGPFVEGSTATLYELNDGFAQTGRSFRDIIADNKGSFEIKGVELISPYAMLEASGYYRNEVTGEVSKGPITLFAIADIREKDNVNVNLLTHLEYYRVLNLVEGGKSVAEAKKQAQKEILAVFSINGNFENSEDMSIFGTTEGDAALLAISVLLQGNLVEGEFSQRLTNFAQSLKESGKWENETAKAAIADWVVGVSVNGDYCKYADLGPYQNGTNCWPMPTEDMCRSGTLVNSCPEPWPWSFMSISSIRNNILAWGLSSEVPDFGKYVIGYWAAAYGLGGCSSANEGEVKKDNRSVYRICKTGNWTGASVFEYDTYQWICLDENEGEIKAGNVSSKDYVCENKVWRVATSVETDIQSVCLASIEGEIKAGKTTGTDYICKNKGWVAATEFERDSYKWVCSDTNEGEIKAGNVSGRDYICKNKGWVTATEFERDTYKWVCSDANEGEIKAGNVSGRDYICKNKGWVAATEFERDTYKWVCSDANEGEIKAGNVSGKDYVCKNKGWVTATEFERDTYKWVCSDANIGEIKKGNVSSRDYVCENKAWRVATSVETDIQSVCLASNEGEIKAGKRTGTDYICKNKGWVTATEFERDTYKWSCSDANEGEIKAGNVSGKDYICKNKGWVTATEFERDTYKWVCSDANIGEIKKGNVSNKDYVCKYDIWREANYKDKYCFENDCKYFIDPRDNQRYTYVEIGQQTWMAENLNYEAEGSKCYGNLDSNCGIYGRLYKLETAKTVCPSGWHLPTEAEWNVMTAYIGGTSTEGKKLKATSGWSNNGNSTDEYGFSALPGGHGYSEGHFADVGYNGFWRIASESNSDYAYSRYMYSNYERASWVSYDKSDLFSVRCVQD
jgi:uncharacterized protein (TIGR02145 family)